MPKQTPGDIAISGNYEHYVALDLTPEEISERHPVDWEHYDEDGLGRAAMAGFYVLDGGYYMLRHLYQAPIPATTIMLVADVAEPELLIEAICDDFGFTGENIIWTLESMRYDMIRGGAKREPRKLG